MQYETLPLKPLAETLTEAIEESADICDAAFSGDAGIQDLYGLGLERCLFQGCRLTGCDFTRCTLKDVCFRDCDLAGVRFEDAGLHQVQFQNCRAVGTYFTGTLLEEVIIEGGSFDYSNHVNAQWKHCTLTACFRDAAFTSLTARKTVVAGCDFSRADWSHAQISGLDLSDADISGSLFSLDALQGVIVSQEQAIDLARLLGLIIRS